MGLRRAMQERVLKGGSQDGKVVRVDNCRIDLSPSADLDAFDKVYTFRGEYDAEGRRILELKEEGD